MQVCCLQYTGINRITSVHNEAIAAKPVQLHQQ